MPYIKQSQRAHFECSIEDFEGLIETPGDLNYIFTRIIHDYIKSKGEKYQHYNDVIGALECCKMELYRRKIAPYEDEAIIRNGDV